MGGEQLHSRRESPRKPQLHDCAQHVVLAAWRQSLSENIEAARIIDRFLEYSRICVFRNRGDEKVFIGSADWMPRNFDCRAEVLCPAYDPDLKKA